MSGDVYEGRTADDRARGVSVLNKNTLRYKNI